MHGHDMQRNKMLGLQAEFSHLSEAKMYGGKSRYQSQEERIQSTESQRVQSKSKEVHMITGNQPNQEEPWTMPEPDDRSQDGTDQSWEISKPKYPCEMELRQIVANARNSWCKIAKLRCSQDESIGNQ